MPSACEGDDTGRATRPRPTSSSNAHTQSTPTTTNTLASAMSTLSLAIKKPFLSATTILSDATLRKKSAAMLSEQTSARIITPLRAGLTTLFDGPRQVQSTLKRLQKEYSEKRMDALLEKQRDENQDVQVGFLLYEDAPQELRARLWMAVLEDVDGELVREYNEAMRSDVGSGEDEYRDEGGHSTSLNSTVMSIQDVYGKAKDLSMITPWNKRKESYRNKLMKAMVEVEWPLVLSAETEGRGGHGEAPTDAEILAASASPMPASTSAARGSYHHDYQTLLQISVGQEDVDDIISRDIHRTFPEHPLFGFEQGQKSLFNLLKAYSLHDLEVGYCQGMAFVAGLLLFYVPEEPAFTIFCRLMDADDAFSRAHSGLDGCETPEKREPDRKTVRVGLRELYLPGLFGLKHKLGMFDELLQRYLPTLKAHLEAHGVVSMLYCTQWFLSIYACPFPVHFCARLIDVMLLQGDQGILLRTAMAIMCECEKELLILEDFEALLVHLKVDPLTWSGSRLRRVLNAALNSPILDAEMAELGDIVLERIQMDVDEPEENAWDAVIEEGDEEDVQRQDGGMTVSDP